MSPAEKRQSTYLAIIESVFLSKYKRGDTEVLFSRNDLSEACRILKLKPPSNMGDIVYSQRYRSVLPQKISATQPAGKQWLIFGDGKSQYRFKLLDSTPIVPNKQLIAIKFPDATPEIVSAYALSDEQALLAKVRYNRLLDIFLGIATYSLQSHLRTAVNTIGQIEIDELYVGVDYRGCQYVLPVQAKGGKDRLSVIQAWQDIAYCRDRFPALACRAISAQFVTDKLIALFELICVEDAIKIAEERHYQLVSANRISSDDLKRYSLRA